MLRYLLPALLLAPLPADAGDRCDDCFTIAHSFLVPEGATDVDPKMPRPDCPHDFIVNRIEATPVQSFGALPERWSIKLVTRPMVRDDAGDVYFPAVFLAAHGRDEHAALLELPGGVPQSGGENLEIGLKVDAAPAPTWFSVVVTGHCGQDGLDRLTYEEPEAPLETVSEAITRTTVDEVPYERGLLDTARQMLRLPR